MERYYQDRTINYEIQYNAWYKELSHDYDVMNTCISAEKQKRDDNIKKIKNQKKRFMIIFAIALFIALGVLTYVLGTFVFVKETPYTYKELTNGQDVVCYVTDTGDCYHKRYCSFLKSVNETTMYKAEKNGYSPCSYCWNYPMPNYETVTKIKYKRYYGVVLGVSFVILLITYIFSTKKYSKWYKKRIDNENNALQKIKDEYLKKIEEKTEDEDDFLKSIMYYSEVPSDVEYKNGLPYTEDNRFMVYKSFSGKFYHTLKYCRQVRMNEELHAFVAMNFLSPCCFCVKNTSIPEWHLKYKKIYELYKRIITLCK